MTPWTDCISPGNSPGQNTGVSSCSLLQGIFLLPGDLPNPGTEPRSPTLQADSLPAEPPGKPKNTGVGSLSIRSPGDHTNPGIKPEFPALQADSSTDELLEKSIY